MYFFTTGAVPKKAPGKSAAKGKKGGGGRKSKSPTPTPPTPVEEESEEDKRKREIKAKMKEEYFAALYHEEESCKVTLELIRLVLMDVDLLRLLFTCNKQTIKHPFCYSMLRNVPYIFLTLV